MAAISSYYAVLVILLLFVLFTYWSIDRTIRRIPEFKQTNKNKNKNDVQEVVEQPKQKQSLADDENRNNSDDSEEAANRSPPPIPTQTETQTQTDPRTTRPQYVFLIHYHKTGHDIVDQYNRTVRDIAHHHSTLPVLRQIVEPTQFKSYRFRSHERATRCPRINYETQPQTTKLLYEKLETSNNIMSISPSKIRLIVMKAPDFFCNLNENDIFFQYHNRGNNKNKNKRKKKTNESNSNSNRELFLSHDGKRHDVKFIHMIRDPFDMAISSYLYHSQQPTPEVWVKRLKRPCQINHDLLQYGKGALVNDNTTTTRNRNTFPENDNTTSSSIYPLTPEKAHRLEDLCHELMVNPDTRAPYETFFEALVALPPKDGLRLSTVVFMAMDTIFATGDLLRMANNVWRLNEWQQAQQQHETDGDGDGATSHSNPNSNSQSSVLSLIMGRDWSIDHYEESLTRMTQFLLDDLEILETTDTAAAHARVSLLDNDNDHDNRDNSKLQLQRAKEAFVRSVSQTSLEIRLKASPKPKITDDKDKHDTVSKNGRGITKDESWNNKHFTKNRLSPSERLELEEQLRSDDLLGPILMDFRTIVETAHGLKKH